MAVIKKYGSDLWSFLMESTDISLILSNASLKSILINMNFELYESFKVLVSHDVGKAWEHDKAEGCNDEECRGCRGQHDGVQDG